MSGCKINQNMEFGDIIYFILLVFFVILGFFNDSRKKRQQQQSEVESRPFFDEESEIVPPRIEKHKVAPPPIPVPYSSEGVHKDFRSSLDLVSIHDEQPSHPSYTFDYNVNSFYEDDPDSPEISDNAREEVSNKTLHPLIKALRDDTGHEELKKGLIYGEIMLRKY